MNPFTQLISLLSSTSSRFYCTESEMVAALSSVIHLADRVQLSESEFPSYKDRVAKELTPILSLASDKEITITTEYTSADITPGSIAYYPIMGMILSDSWWWFSSKQFVDDLLAADANPNINVHFLHIKSGGGEAWFLDKVAETLTQLKKPIYTFGEKIVASAAYYIGVHGNVFKTLTQNDTIGSIGTMVDGLDYMAYLEKMGMKRIKALATRSDLKNKKTEDLRNGKPDQFIREELDPLQQQFEAAVRSARPQLNDLPDDSPVFRAETFYASTAIDLSLIDGLSSFPDALSEADTIGKEWAAKQSERKSLLSYL